MYTKQLLTAIAAIIASAQLSLQASTAYDPFYYAGVVEFRPSNSTNSEGRLLDNLAGYLSILNSEASKDLDIIVFPEATLNDNEQATFVPNPAKGLIVPCDAVSSEYHSLLLQLSCAAKKLSVYVVINLTEKELCSLLPEDTRPCASSGLNLYNTNVVFDRKGAIISRYRKVHLYGENKNVTFFPEIAWFETDFGIRFGHFICFDILFYAPAQSLVIYNGIKDFIFPTMWFSQLPFLTALQVQQGWSYANNVNLLAAGASNPLVGFTGTGIYHGRQGIIVAKMNHGMGERELYAAKVPKYRFLSKRSISDAYSKQNVQSKPNITLKRDKLQHYKTIPINLTTGTSLNQELCFSNSSFCCTFALNWQSLKFNTSAQVKHYRYRLGVYDGWRSEPATETNQLKNCALFSCAAEDIMDCGQLLDIEADVVFENITITATFPKAERFLIMPNSLNESVMPLPVNHFRWQEIHKKNTLQVRYELNTTTPNVMAFSIYGNYYDCIADIIPDKGNRAASLINYGGLMGILLINFLL